MRSFLSALLVMPFLSFSQTADEILAKSLAYHDASAAWPTLQATFFFTETRPTSPDRSTTIELRHEDALQGLKIAIQGRFASMSQGGDFCLIYHKPIEGAAGHLIVGHHILLV